MKFRSEKSPLLLSTGLVTSLAPGLVNLVGCRHCGNLLARSPVGIYSMRKQALTRAGPESRFEMAARNPTS